MSSEWTPLVLSEVIEVKHGWAFKGDYMSEDAGEGPVVVAIGNFDYSGGFRFSSTKIKRYSSSYPREYELQGGDILLAMTCQTPGGEILGLPGMIPSDGELYLHNQRLGKLIVKNPSRVCPQYLYWIFLSYDFNRYLAGSATGTKILHTSPSKIVSYETRMPPLEVQKDISRFLWAISDKVELNQKINQTLEQMAQALFKSWFVDFEPVKSKIAARQRWQALQPGNEPASPVCYATELDEQPYLGDLESYMNRAAMQAIAGKTAAQLDTLRAEDPERYRELFDTAALFPSAMQDSELGEIPEGWEISTVGREFDVTMGQSPPGDTYNETGEGTPFFQGRRDFGERFPSNRVYCTQPKRMAKRGDTLLSVRAPVGDTNIALTDCCIGRGLAAIRHKSGCSSFTYYSIIQLSYELSSYDSEGTVFGSINQKNLKDISQLVPPHEVLSSFQKAAKALDELIKVNSEELASLAAMRDTLLPKLLSGEISTVNRGEA
ncbi:restriction endonuclease subunit S [Halomonas sp. McH1-25]|uniref:restriction endonuclease subunit S n=1 Tax=unclassified Halomonas TaxID=2609666 RepID=UPI001EF4B983|nr:MULTISPECIES: restriction endonuclease subunit S [unclassified Halomonas]MCG7601494.1 restriction endonuclease subunit S [Halomonas sp. McH1-25]MCP1344684.1 restriction endonuclease subunit S [Halomonas sp. FL8]MCP1363267.1 restriction endonuclease subunit S [Halomonas sp. BBD45]MCP1364714.1 restriction endonuclease subunit S [Halomonas sp. BBD48]